MNALNRYRARRCNKALRHYDTDSEANGCLIDFLADARHWCDRNGENYAQLDRLPYEHYSTEVLDARRGRS